MSVDSFFSQATPRWLHEPSRWSRPGPDALLLHVERGTDFWQRTHYGFQRDNGHFLGVDVPGDFEMQAGVETHPVGQYDQAGLMVRVSEHCWLKTSIEYEGEQPSRLGVVVTNDGWSDWSTQDVPASMTRVWLRVQRQSSDFTVFWRHQEASPWSQMRIARLGGSAGVSLVRAGPYACAPQGPGFKAHFFGLDITPRPDAA